MSISLHPNYREQMNDIKFETVIETKRNSNSYENPEKQNERGLNQSGKSIILILRNVTNKFLDKLVKIYNSNQSSKSRLKQVSNIFDELPWNQLDTEEKEFMTDELFPAIKTAGINPLGIIQKQTPYRFRYQLRKRTILDSSMMSMELFKNSKSKHL